jgi:hypothetical protein
MSTPKLAKTEDKPKDAEVATDENSDEVEAILSNWEIIDRIPTPEEVLGLLKLLKPQWGVKPEDFLEYIVPLPSNKKVKIEVEREGRKVATDVFKSVYTLYMSVSGRIAMLNAAAEINGWRVDLEPGAGDPTLPPGFIELGKSEDEHIVYREQCVIFRNTEDGMQAPLGVKTGTAWVKARGGQQAAGSNPYEKCVSPGTRVLTDDLRWVDVADLAPGDTLLAFDEDPAGRGVGQRFRRSTVEAVKAGVKPSVEVRFDGMHVRCSADHQFVVSRKGTYRQWVAAADLVAGDRVVSVGRPWDRLHSRDAGWMAGFLDGEGHIGNGLLRFTQVKGKVLDEACRILDEHEVPYSMNVERRSGAQDIVRGHVTGGHLASVRALGMFRPVRLDGEACWLDRRSFGKSLRTETVQSVEAIGEADVVVMQTSTRTFIAEGLFSHNCETAARGRAIAGWGIGVLPGSGVASLDEMRNRPREYEDARKARTVPRQSRDDLIARAQEAAEAVRLLRGADDDWLISQLADYATKKFGVDVVKPATDDEPASILWGKWKDGQLTLLIADLEQRRKKLALDSDEEF